MKISIVGVMLFLILTSTIMVLSNAKTVRADEPVASEPTVETTDFGNGTRQMITDYGNGTRNGVVETYIKKAGELVLPEEANESLDAIVPTTLTSMSEQRGTLPEDSKYLTTTQTAEMTQPMMFGFTYVFAYWQQQWSQDGRWWIFTWYLTVGIDVDIEFGLRLPMNVTLEYPEQMLVGNNYTLHATLTPVDKPGFDELDFKFKANVWAQADVNVGPVHIGFPRTVLAGPNVDESESFVTPFGSGSAPLSSDIEINIFDVLRQFHDPSLNAAMDIISTGVVPYLILQPTFGSDKITATASATGDSRVVEGEQLNWSMPNQTLDFTVNADEYDPSTNYTKITLSGFRYYFTYFGVDILLKFDLNDILNGWPLYWPNPEITIATLDMSWINKYIKELTGTIPYVTPHLGYPESVYVILYVDRVVNPSPPPPPLEDVAISYAFVYPPKVILGENITVSIGAKNLGNVSETFDVTIYANGAIIDEQPVVDLAAGEEIGLNFDWNTTGLLPWQTYNITAEASQVTNEIDVENNVLFAGFVQIVLPSPQADFTYSPIPPIRNQTTTFDANSSTSSGTIVMYEWNFGEDGANITTTSPIATYVFAYNGKHKITLTVIDSNGLNDTALEIIDVLQHDVAVVGVLPYRSWVYEGRLVSVNVTLLNCGDFNETVTVNLYYNITASQQIGTMIADLSPNETRTLTFVWNTLGIQHCHNYTITALANIQFDSNTTDNVKEGMIARARANLKHT